MPGFYPPKNSAVRPAVTAALGEPARYGDPDWLGRLRRGITLILWGFITTCLALAAAFALAGRRHVLHLTVEIPLSLASIGLIAYLAGLWMLTSPDPDGVAEKRGGRSRKFVRVSLLLSIVITALSLVQYESRAAVRFFEIGSIINSLIADVAFIAGINYQSKLAARVGDHFLSDQLRKLTIGMAAVFIALFAGAAGFLLCVRFHVPLDPALMPLIEFAVLVVGLTGLALAIIDLFLLEKLGRKMKKRQSEGTGR